MLNIPVDTPYGLGIARVEVAIGADHGCVCRVHEVRFEDGAILRQGDDGSWRLEAADGERKAIRKGPGQ